MIRAGLMVSMLFLSVASARAEKGPTGNGDTHPIILTADTCQKLDDLAAGLVEWTAKMDHHPIVASERKSVEKAGQCTRDLSDALPTQIKRLHEFNAPRNGPNCWNAALVMAGVLPSFRYMPAAEFSFWLKSPLCHKVANDDLILAGDVSAIRIWNSSLNDWEEVHGFTNLSADYAFSKNGFHDDQPYAVTTTKKVIEDYKFRVDNSHDFDRGYDRARVIVDRYRCTSVEQYLEVRRTQMGWKLRDLNQRAVALEKCISHMTFEFLFTPALKPLVTASVDALEMEIKQAMVTPELKMSDRLDLLTALEFKIQSLKYQADSL